MAVIEVQHLAEDAFRISTRGHTVLADQPAPNGSEVGPSPVELFVMALATCAAHYSVGYLRKRALPADGLSVRCEWAMRAGPPRVGRVALLVRTPHELGQDERAGLLDAIDRCTVTNTLREPPPVQVTVDTLDRAEPAGS